MFYISYSCNILPMNDDEQEIEVSTSGVLPTKHLTGQVKWFNTKAGYGFITVFNEGPYLKKDVFVHYSSIKVVNSQYKYLVQGEYVEFDVENLENGKYEVHAINISGIMKGPLMCETRSFLPPPVNRRREYVSGGERRESVQKKRENTNYDDAGYSEVRRTRKSVVKTTQTPGVPSRTGR